MIDKIIRSQIRHNIRIQTKSNVREEVLNQIFEEVKVKSQIKNMVRYQAFAIFFQDDYFEAV